MSEKNKAILEEANAANAAGNYEGFLSFCTDDTKWTFVGDKTLNGKEAVRQYMAETRSVERNLKAEKKGAEKSILSPINRKMMSDAIVVSQYCQIAPEATITE